MGEGSNVTLVIEGALDVETTVITVDGGRPDTN